ncbi:unnamed protein product [Arctia plantaginis]|uniref:Cilia- and flagella-associated protein 157 n=1 Tax=Arctia plantaginis TaxID=874455 RepID=A0A8S0ZUT1_ARCPL|nr:unnamed protein product [Arctia plantaginis]CAB3255540.1 unnamed protein product [Arctia plantaginis]
MAPKPPAPAPSGQRNQAFREVDKAMYELQIADLNRKLARFRASIAEYEQRNIDLQNAYDQLDEDRADIIAYLKKTLNVKNEENAELKDRVKSLEELRELETAQFREKISELEKNFTTMKDQLTSENKLLAGKLNTLEEFRAIKDALMQKFEKQEREFEAQEMKYKRVIYDAEKKFVIGKDKLKKEMEGRLLQLAQEFQDASEARIAASTHRVIRENIALNNQLDSLLLTQAKVAEQNEKYKEDERAARNAMEVAEAERDKAINKSIVQIKVIEQLTTAFRTASQNKALHDKQAYDLDNLQVKVQKLTKENENMILQIRILEQNLHSCLGQQSQNIIETKKLTKERDKYKQVIKSATSAIQAALKVDLWATIDPRREILERKVVLTNILDVINQHHRAICAESVDSLVSLTDVYEKGDLGFVPKPKALARKSKTLVEATKSQESVAPKRSTAAASTTISSLGTVKTMPSLDIMPQREDLSISSRESIPSFTVTSIHSHVSESDIVPEDSFEALTDVEKQLALSKLEIQKSILKDLALSGTGLHSKSRAETLEPSSKLKISESTVGKRRESEEVGEVESKHSKYEEDEDEKTEGEESEGEKPENEEAQKQELVTDEQAEDKPIEDSDNPIDQDDKTE